MDIKNKIIIVTGASMGIGLATCRLLATHGAKLVLAARSVDLLKKLESELPDAFAVPTDMRKPADIKNMIDAAIGKFGRIDILINNAGQAMYGPAEFTDLNGLQSIMELNVYGPLRAMLAVIPIMRKQGGGMIVNVSSMVSKNTIPNLGAYASTKYALNAIMLTARKELEKDNIIVSVMHPKMTATGFGQHAIGARPNFVSQPRAVPLQIDTPEQVAEKIAELIISEEAEAMM
ncbi:MAG: SDR family NAD(P)-dependent oxidoreductase [bacterium]|nr:SDR family NAD(P)-dependent oxidoreductase [bacterium]